MWFRGTSGKSCHSESTLKRAFDTLDCNRLNSLKTISFGKSPLAVSDDSDPQQGGFFQGLQLITVEMSTYGIRFIDRDGVTTPWGQGNKRPPQSSNTISDLGRGALINPFVPVHPVTLPRGSVCPYSSPGIPALLYARDINIHHVLGIPQGRLAPSCTIWTISGISLDNCRMLAHN